MLSKIIFNGIIPFYMPLSTTQKQEIINKYATVKGDTGSPEVQIALLTTRIERLTEHLKEHGHDVHSRRGLLSMIAKRRRLVNFLGKVDKVRATDITKKVGLKA
jgi:small subunit ribosomal protein S15